MRKVIEQAQNMAKALEIRLEQESTDRYYVIMAGMTVQMRGGCVGGRCEPADEYDYLSIENETFHTFSFTTYHESKSLFDALSHQYMITTSDVAMERVAVG